MPPVPRIRGALGRLNRQPALLSTLRELRRRLPGDPEFGDAMSTAGKPTLGYLVQGVSAISPGQSLVSEVSLTGLQLWQSLSEATGRGRGDLELALLYADVVDSSSMALAAGDDVAVELLSGIAAIVEKCVEGRGGRIVRRLGDGVIATFISALTAVEAALDIQDAVHGVVLEQESAEGRDRESGPATRLDSAWRVQLRIGVHFGRPRRLAGEYVGAEVTILAAIGEGARPGQVLVSGPALAQLDPAFHSLRIGRRKRLRSTDAPAELQVAVVRRE